MNLLLLLSLGLIHLFCSPSGNPSQISMTAPSVYTAEHEMPDQSLPYFKAKGSSPEWELQIAEDHITFTSFQSGFETFMTPHTAPVKAADMNVKKYAVKTEAGTMDIQIFQMPCQIPDSREGFSYSVEVMIKRGVDSTFTTFTGCGVYVTDARLHGHWSLHQIKDKVISSTLPPDSLPWLDIKTNVNSFAGFAGCNTISGRLFFEKNLLRFTDIVATKMTCPAATEETSFLNALKFSTQYSIQQDTLSLSYPGHQMLVFIRQGQ
jgi:heat shock protein HslJ